MNVNEVIIIGTESINSSFLYLPVNVLSVILTGEANIISIFGKMITQFHKDIIIKKLAPYNPVSVGVFGSFARNENKQDSDMDILVDFRNVVNLFDLIGLEQDLSEALGVKVDLITLRSLSPFLEPYVNKDLIRIL